jgi:hypothetical protein
LPSRYAMASEYVSGTTVRPIGSWSSIAMVKKNVLVSSRDYTANDTMHISQRYPRGGGHSSPLTPVSTSSTSARTMMCALASPSGPSCGRVVLTILDVRRRTAPIGTGSRKVIWSRARKRIGLLAKIAALVKHSSLRQSGVCRAPRRLLINHVQG